MKHTLSLVFLLLWCHLSNGQKAIHVYQSLNDSTQNFYIKRLPTGTIKGLLVINLRSVTDSSKTYALQHGIMLMGIIALNPDSALQYLTSTKVIDRTDKMITEVVNQYHIPKNKVIVGGMSIGGTGALRYVEYCKAGNSKGKINPVGCFAVDSPLDYERFYKASADAVLRNFNQDAVDEGKAVTQLLRSTLKGTASTNAKAYQKASVYSYSSEDGGNAKLLKDVAIRLYTEPDVNWWIENRRRSYYDFNSIDCAALINQLKLNGNSEAELIVSTNNGYQEDGTRHPHSWSIVNEKDLLNWCLKLFN
jgi:hypothetical protein